MTKEQLLKVSVSAATAVVVYLLLSSVFGGNSIDDAVAGVTEAMQSQLPMQVDEVTTLKTVTAVGPTLTYSYELAIPASTVEPSDLEGFESALSAQACSNEDVKSILDGGANIIYVFDGQDGGEIGQFNVDASDC